MSCKYNNSMYTSNPPEIDVKYDPIEEILFNFNPIIDDYEAQEFIDARLNEEYNAFKCYELNHSQMLKFVETMIIYYGGE